MWVGKELNLENISKQIKEEEDVYNKQIDLWMQNFRLQKNAYVDLRRTRVTVLKGAQTALNLRITCAAPRRFTHKL